LYQRIKKEEEKAMPGIGKQALEETRWEEI